MLFSIWIDVLYLLFVSVPFPPGLKCLTTDSFTVWRIQKKTLTFTKKKWTWQTLEKRRKKMRDIFLVFIHLSVLRCHNESAIIHHLSQWRNASYINHQPSSSSSAAPTAVAMATTMVLARDNPNENECWNGKLFEVICKLWKRPHKRINPQRCKEHQVCMRSRSRQFQYKGTNAHTKKEMKKNKPDFFFSFRM